MTNPSLEPDPTDPIPRKTEIAPFDPNESPLDRIADLMFQHPSRSHSAAVAVYLQQRWEWERKQGDRT